MKKNILSNELCLYIQCLKKQEAVNSVLIITSSMNNKPLVTIGLSTYKRADGYLKHALDAAVSQTWTNLEIIVSDNCSEDYTEELVKGFSDPRINYIKQNKNIGATNNFNFCLKQAKGKYFLLLHDDDLIDSDFIETCMAMVSKNGDTGIIRTGTRQIDNQGLVTSIKPNDAGLTNTDLLIAWFSNKTAFYLCSTLYNTRGLREVGGFTSETNLFNDVAPMLKLAYKYGRLDSVHAKASFRRHDNNRGSAVRVENWMRDSLYLLDIIEKMELVGKADIIKKGKRFFSRKCYRYVQAIPSPVQRLKAYLMIYNVFGKNYSPLMYKYDNFIKPLKVNNIQKRLGYLENWFGKKISTVRCFGRNKAVLRKGLAENSNVIPNKTVDTQDGKKRLRIAFFVGSFPLISETFILNQITGLIDRGHTVDIYASKQVSGHQFHENIYKYGLIYRTKYLWDMPKRTIPRLFILLKLLFTDGWRRPGMLVKALNYRRHGHVAKTLSLILSAIPLSKMEPYDILHCQYGSSGPIVQSLREVNAVTGKLVVSYRGGDITSSFKANASRYKYVFKNADCLMPVSDYFKQKLISEGCPPDKIKVHYSGIDCLHFQFSERNKNESEPVSILTIARLVEKKGIIYAIRAIALTVASGINLKYTIIGDGPLKEEIQNLVSLLRLDKHVTLVGSKTSDEVISYLKRSNIFLAPSITSKTGDAEGIPNVSKEAMAMGLPVISTLHSGNPELIENGKSGFLVPERDAKALAERLSYLIDNPDIWLEISRSGRKVIESKFEINKLNDELVDTYYQLIAKNTYGISHKTPYYEEDQKKIIPKQNKKKVKQLRI
ncbi:MAG: glycosyltransferase [Balneolales bacterium]